MRRIRAIFPLVFLVVAQAQEARNELRELLDRLAASECEFGRNGEWHSGEMAREHLSMKHKYMRMQNPRLTMEEFIAIGASGSSSTSQPYKVRCMGSAEVPASAWLNDQLRVIRSDRN